MVDFFADGCLVFTHSQCTVFPHVTNELYGVVDTSLVISDRFVACYRFPV